MKTEKWIIPGVLNMESHGMTAVRNPVSVDAVSFNQLATSCQWPLVWDSYLFRQSSVRDQGLMVCVE
jgi:hypothetical protein